MPNNFMSTYFKHNVLVQYIAESNSVFMPMNHYHGFYEIYFWYGDNMTYFIDDCLYKVSTNQVVFIDKYLFHRTNYSDCKRMERISILFDETFLSIYSNDGIRQKVVDLFQIKILQLTSELSDVIKSMLIDKILPAFEKSEEHYTADTAKSSFLICYLILTLVQEKDNAIVTSHQHYSQKEERILSIVGYINRFFNTDLTLQNICQMFFVNQYYLCHSFKDVTGMSVIEFINHKRLLEAEQLLLNTSQPVYEIGEVVGFHNSNYFIAQFKKKNHVTPKVYRKQHD